MFDDLVGSESHAPEIQTSLPIPFQGIGQTGALSELSANVHCAPVGVGSDTVIPPLLTSDVYSDNWLSEDSLLKGDISRFSEIQNPTLDALDLDQPDSLIGQQTLASPGLDGHDSLIGSIQTPQKISSISNTEVGPARSQIDYYSFRQGYELARIEYQQILLDKDRQLEVKDRQLESLHHIVKVMVEKNSSKYDLRGANFSGGFAETVHGNQIGGAQYNYAAPEKQDLAEAAGEIQRLLKQLEATNPTATEAEQKAFVTAAIPPTLRQRAASALQTGGKVALEELLDNPYVNVAIAVIEGWREVES